MPPPWAGRRRQAAALRRPYGGFVPLVDVGGVLVFVTGVGMLVLVIGGGVAVVVVGGGGGEGCGTEAGTVGIAVSVVTGIIPVVSSATGFPN